MPIEIKELHIKFTVNAQSNPAGGQSSGGGGNTGANSGSDAQQALVAECVEQVLQILKEKAER